MAQITVCCKATYSPVSTFNYVARCTELQNKINGLAKKIGIPNVQFKLNNKFSICEAGYSRSQNYILLSPFFLLNFEDIPECLRGLSSQHDKLTNKEFLNNVIKDIFSIFDKSNLPLYLSSPSDATEFILSLKNKELFEKMKQFTIAHELSHMKHHKLLQRFEVFEFEYKKFWIQQLFCFFVLIFIPVAYLSLFNGSGGADFISSCPLGEQTDLFSEHDMERILAYKLREGLFEKLADLDAVNFILDRDIEGAIYFFETLLISNKAWRNNEGRKWEKYIDKDGNFLVDKKHPSLTERIKYIKDLQKNQTPKSNLSQT